MPLPIPANYADVQTDFDPIVGNFRATIEKCEHAAVKDETEAKWQNEKGHPGEDHPGVIKWVFGSLENLDDPSDEQYANRKVFYNSPLTQEGRGLLFPALVAVGYDSEELKAPKAVGETLDFEPSEQLGKTVILKLAKNSRDDTKQSVFVKPDDTNDYLP